MFRKIFFILLFFISTSILANTPPPIPPPEPSVDLSNQDEILKSLAAKEYRHLKSSLDQTSNLNDEALLLLRGYLNCQLGEDDLAIADLNHVIANSPSLKLFATQWLMKAAIHAKKFSIADAAFQPQASVTQAIEVDLLVLKAEAMMGLKKFAEAKALVTKYQKNLGGKSDLLSLKIAVESGNTTQAIAKAKKYLVNNAGSSEEPTVIHYLQSHNLGIEKILTSSDFKIRAENLVKNGYPKLALEIYQKLGPQNYAEEIAFATFKARDYKTASILYKKLWDLPKAGLNKLDILDKLTSSYARSDQFDDAIWGNKKIISLYPTSSEAKLAAYKIPFVYLDSGNYKKAIEAYTDYLSQKGATRKADAQWDRMWAYYHDGQYAKALAELQKFEKNKNDNNTLLKIYYWEGRIYQKISQPNLAKEKFRAVISKAKVNTLGHYYAGLSMQRLKSDLIPNILAQSLPLKTQKNISPINYQQCPGAIGEPLCVSILLGTIGFSERAYEVSQNSSLLKSGYPIQDLAQLLLSAHNFSRLMGIGVVAIKVDPPTTIGSQSWVYAYPQAYLAYVAFYGQQAGVDPAIIWSIMRQESAFKPVAESNALALGLMQMIPQTAQEVAATLNDKEFKFDDLKNPQVAIMYGSKYLSQLSSQFSNNIVHIIAAYNAGPDAVERWKRVRGNLEADEFIELIPYDETNSYVKRVLTNYWVYKALY